MQIGRLIFQIAYTVHEMENVELIKINGSIYIVQCFFFFFQFRARKRILSIDKLNIASYPSIFAKTREKKEKKRKKKKSSCYKLYT